ncbi:unnamed protein product [Rotaria socialis]|uniref:Uncharacterized protein n=2 Tax=Rotaria socialis TaxID=392032 RepID=A0A818VNL4_9BILA|nr:unnamed protein product [Rotaria socialis]CAF3241267.1 unnamed protein product [Rotaria socialis]CAF3713265.1 unnamed protein product [Rotaria socialis]CAF4464537.1 unnamed protein product [Rotaria socialis]CAF4502030.1 unnamed protein product [Rotaria socialis]
MNKTTTTSSSIIALDIIPDLENNRVFFIQEKSIESQIHDMANIQIVQIEEDELDIELGPDFDDDYPDEDEEYDDDDYDDDYEDDNEMIQQLQTMDVNKCPAA